MDVVVDESWVVGGSFGTSRPEGIAGASQPPDCPTSICCVQSLQLQLQAPSGDTVPARSGLPVTQLLRILNPNKVSSRSAW